MTTAATANRSGSDAELLREVGKAFFGRDLPSGGVVWQREMSRAIGVSVSQLQAMIAGRPLTAANKVRLAKWVAKARQEERQQNARRYVLLRDLRKRVA